MNENNTRFRLGYHGTIIEFNNSNNFCMIIVNNLRYFLLSLVYNTIVAQNMCQATNRVGMFVFYICYGKPDDNQPLNNSEL